MDPINALTLPAFRLGARQAGSFLKKPKTPKQQKEVTPEQETSLTRDLSNKAVGLFSTAGNLLDLAGGASRNLLSGKNPLAVLNDPTGDSTRASGREMLTKWGLTKPNNPNKWELADAAGFGAEVLTDPMTYLTFGGSALSKAGKAFKMAGLQRFHRYGDMAARLGGENLLRLRGTPKALMGSRAEWKRFSNAAKAMGQNPAALAKQNLGGLVGVKVPFMRDPLFTLGHGPVAGQIAHGIDVAKGAIRNSPPVDFLHRMLNVRTGGYKGRVAQRILGAEGHERVGRAISKGLKPYLDVADDLARDGLTDKQSTERLRAAVEGHYQGPLTHSEQNAVSTIQRMNQETRDRNLRKGIKNPELQDTTVMTYHSPGSQSASVHGPDLRDESWQTGYAHRSLTQYGDGKPLGRGANKSAMSVADPSMTAREDFLRHFKNGTSDLNRILADKRLNQMIDRFNADPSAYKGQRGRLYKEVAEYLEQKYGPKSADFVMAPEYQKFSSEGIPMEKNGMPVMADHFREFAKWAATLPSEARQRGGFMNHAVVDAASHAVRQKIKQAKATTVHRFLAEVSRPAQPLPFNVDKPYTVGQIYKQLNLKTPTQKGAPGAAKQLASLLGYKKWNAKVRREIMSRQVDKESAEQLFRYFEQYKMPDPAGSLTNLADSLTHLHKAGVLTWPARYSRDWTSATAQNLIHHMGSVFGMRGAWNAFNGRDIQGSAEIPFIRSYLKRRGIPITDENATKQIRSMMGSRGGQGTYQAQEATRDINNLRDPGIEALNEMQPGAGGQKSTLAQNIKAVGDTLTRRGQTGKDLSFNPLDIEGVGGRRKSRFAPVVAGNQIGRFTDYQPRMNAMLTMLKQGYHPDEARHAADFAHVNYSSREFTPFERNILKRVFPFYSFTSRQAPVIAKELTQHPGGRLANVIRATNLSRGDRSPAMTPDYVAETTSIPLSDREDGTKRFVTGLGLMHEDPFSFTGGGLRGAGLEALSRTNPLIKAPFEYLTGQSFFQKGPEGGRPLGDMDPVIGRLAANVTGRKDAYRLNPLLELAASNSPVSRALTTAKTLTDTRKTPLEKFFNVATGARVTDVSTATQDALLREAAQKAMKGIGAKNFERIYFPEDKLAQMSPQERKSAKDWQNLLNTLADRAKRRAVQQHPERQKKKKTGRTNKKLGGLTMLKT